MLGKLARGMKLYRDVPNTDRLGNLDYCSTRSRSRNAKFLAWGYNGNPISNTAAESNLRPFCSADALRALLVAHSLRATLSLH